MSNNEIVFVTGNANKLKEVQSILTQEVDNNNKTIHLINEALDLEELQDTDLNAIALAKGKQAVAALGKGKPVFVEDTALRFDEFNGLPGAYIKWFFKEHGIGKNCENVGTL
ncbi:Ham1p [Saccharomyces cerevisiae AWRI796]|nr:Ham1p [Saccharomyces cerevisiae AWRI796]